MANAHSHQLQNDFYFAPLTEEHLAMLHEWLLRPHIAHWWGEAESIEELHDAYLSTAGQSNRTLAYIAQLGGKPVGFIQSYVVKGSGGGWWESETDPGARGTDQFLANPSQLGLGMGRRMISTFLGQLFEDQSVTVVQTDPDPSNERAIRCYNACGFQTIGEVVTPDGPALLMRCTRQTFSS